MTAINNINANYASQAREKEDKIEKIFDNLPLTKVQEINLVRGRNPDHPVNLMTEFILGQIY